MGTRATERITTAISEAMNADEDELVNAMTHVLDTAYQGDEGRLAVWLHLSGAESSLKPNMQQIVELSHQLRKSHRPDATFENTNRLVMLITLVGEVVSGAALKEAMGFEKSAGKRAHFRRWLAEIMLNLSDEELNTSLSSNAGTTTTES